jgi:hypothetical protein
MVGSFLPYLNSSFLCLCLILVSGCGPSKSGQLQTDSASSSPDDPPSPVTSPTPAYTVTAAKTSESISLDRLLTEDVWGLTQLVRFSDPLHSDNEVRVRIVYTDSHLYIAYEVTDSQREATGAVLWQDDGADIYLDAGYERTAAPDANDRQFLANINGATNNPLVMTTTQVTTDGYLMKVAIPWSAIGVEPTAGRWLGVLLANGDRDAGVSSQFDWTKLVDTGAFARPNLWGTLILGTEAP